MTTATGVKETPILFKGDMVRALLSGEKTQTRRIMKPQPSPVPSEPNKHWWRSSDIQKVISVEKELQSDDPLEVAGFHPKGGLGHRLWVREAFCLGSRDGVIYKADNPSGRFLRDAGYPPKLHYKPSIHMPRFACRIVLEITEVRVQRIQEITESDIVAEGIREYIQAKGLDPDRTSFRAAWIDLWDVINGKRGQGRFAWDRNPWTWAITFRRVEGGGA